ncbi:MAG: AraC family transcriptional regulator [Verrucomicrobiota bacterium]|nr:AraC family transcriptional regulator [Verrucomicrobiota bacterium]
MSDNLHSILQRAWKKKRDESAPFAGPSHYQIGLETQTLPSDYYWDGMRRESNKALPMVVFQYTLEGCGQYSTAARVWPLPAGEAILAIVPTAHVYCLPETSASWTFFWFILRHPYLVQRVVELVAKTAPVLSLPAASPAILRAAELFTGACAGSFPNVSAQEQALFDWFFALETQALDLTHPPDLRQQMLESVRRFTLNNMARAPDVSDLAEANQLSRSNFSHLFHAATGFSPAAYMLQVRLEESARQLLKPSATIKEIAAATGFANANHFGKCFRRLYGNSPGAYLKQSAGRRQ